MKKISLCLLLSTFFLATFCQKTIFYQFTYLSAKKGLSSSYTRKILQDPLGFMWIATQDGLSRFDGVQFTSYIQSSLSKNAISGSDVRDLLLDTLNNVVWALYSYGGFDAINYKTGEVTFKFQQAKFETTKNVLFNSFCIKDNRLLIASSGGLFSFDIESKKLNSVNFPSPFSNPSSGLWINKILCDSIGYIWLFCNDDGICIVQNKSLKLISFLQKQDLTDNPRDSSISFFDCCEINNNVIIAGTDMGLKSFSLKDKTLTLDTSLKAVKSFLGKKNVYACYVDAKNNVWVACEKYLLKSEQKAGVFFLLKENKGQTDNNLLRSVYSIYNDTYDNIWLSCQQGVAYSQNKQSAFQVLYKSEKSTSLIDHTYGIFPEDSNSIYISAVNGFYKVNNAAEILPLSEKQTFFYSFKDPFGRIWASNLNGTFLIHGDQFIPINKVYPEFSKFDILVINSSVSINDSLIILGTENKKGVILWWFKKSVCLILNNKSTPAIKENVINTVFKDNKGYAWILSDNSVAIFDASKMSIDYLQVENIKAKEKYSIFFDACFFNNKYYIASYGAGILEFSSGRNFLKKISVSDGLTNNGVYKIIPYKDTLLIVTTNRGINILNSENKIIKTYFEEDGLQSDIFEERAGSLFKNYVYAGGVNGFTIIDPSKFTVNTTPPVFYFTNIKVSTKDSANNIDTSNLEMKKFDIPNSWLQTNISFVGLNYGNPNRVTYQYRILQKDTNWTNLSTQNFISLIGMSPGSYTLEVKAANEDGYWCQPKQLTLIFQPYWYQTNLFKVSVFLAVAALFYALYKYRISQLKKQQQIRKEIASDLHDDIGSTLNSVKIFTHLAEISADKQSYFTQIKEALKQASIGLRDMIWVLDDMGDTIAELITRLQQFTVPLSSAENIHIIFESRNTEKIILDKNEKRNLLLITKEAVNNSIKYSQCTKIQISFEWVNKKLKLSITDDGQGFDMSNYSAGNGLKNIQQRAKQIHYTSSISSAQGQGTSVYLYKN